MNKKILKRSVMLGALMAFVITGSAWAYTNENGKVVPGANDKDIIGETIDTRSTNFIAMDSLDNMVDEIVKNKKFVVQPTTSTGGAGNISGNISFDNCIFYGNQAKKGGAIYFSATDAQEGIIKNSTFENNIARGGGFWDPKGGAVDVNTGTLKLENNMFRNNTADYWGGAIELQKNTAKLNLVGYNHFEGNSAKFGGAVVAYNGKVYLGVKENNVQTETTFKGNKAYGSSQYGGGAILLTGSNSELNVYSDVKFEENYAAWNGGAISNSGTINFVGGTATFKDNTATEDGGAIYNSGKVYFKNGSKVTFSGNTVDGKANDIYNTGNIYVNNGADVTINGGITGAGKVNVDGKLTLNAAAIANVATFNAGSELVIDGATFSDNVYALIGAGKGSSLTVAEGALITVEGIDTKTYNVATNFAGINATEKYWNVTNLNSLMEGEWLKEENNLQLKVVAKDAEQLADEMGVSETTAGALNAIVVAANDPNAPQTDAARNVKDFANALTGVAPEVAGQEMEAVAKMAEAVGNSATAANIVKNVTGITNDRLSFNCGHSAPHKGGNGVGLFEEGSGADVWVEYVHGKDEVEDMPSSAGASSYEGQYNGIVMGVDFKKVGKFQSGFAFNYGEGDTNSVGTISRIHNDYDFWGIGYYGNIHNDDTNVIFDINYAKTDSDVSNYNLVNTYEASPETTIWTAGVKLEKLYQNENVTIVPYTGLRYMSINADDYATKCGTFNYKMDRQDVWLLPLGVSIKQEVVNDNGWTVSPRVDLSYIWAFGDTDNNMEFATALNTKTNIGYDVMDDGSFLGLVGIEAHKGQWGYGVSYSYQKGDHSTSKKWFVDVNYSF